MFDQEPDPYAFESRVAIEECDQCGKDFEVDVDAPRPELILCDPCWVLHREEQRVDACLIALQRERKSA